MFYQAALENRFSVRTLGDRIVCHLEQLLAKLDLVQYYQYRLKTCNLGRTEDNREFPSTAGTFSLVGCLI